MYKLIISSLLSLTFLLSSHASANNCEDAKTSIQMNRCAAIKLEVAHHQMTKYLDATYELHAKNTTALESIKIAQKDWETHIASHCDSIYAIWEEGRKKAFVSIFCMIDKTDERTAEIWKTYLSNSDKPVLPKPQK
ncbi:lysozyme inhibitor LprI family protein [Neptuniibacter sp. QD57_21]|uniref:lysozyme inhibitor LprI family protein n=1 Tax=Neptuniibacter sp. QD57_21 TaxID=3398213 RepID=UPI0039F6196D